MKFHFDGLNRKNHGAPRVILAIALTGCTALTGLVTVATANAAASIDHTLYGTAQDGRSVQIYTMTNEHGVRVRFLDYGGVITEIAVPDRMGRLDDIVLGLRNLHDYETLSAHYGAITGRFANRIAGAKFSIDGTEYNVTKNSGPNILHGGRKGFNKVIWKAEPLKDDNSAAVRLTYRSVDGEEGLW